MKNRKVDGARRLYENPAKRRYYAMKRAERYARWVRNL